MLINMSISNTYINVPVIAGLGNPLLDISVTLIDNSILDKFRLKPDGQTEVSSEEFSNILKFVERGGYAMVQSPGGCVQNSLRILQSLVGRKHFCAIFGGIGDDEKGRFLEAQLIDSGVLTRYAKHISHKTGMAISLINGESRSLVAHLGAAEVYRIEDFNKPLNLNVMKEVSVVYIEGFFITHSLDVALDAIRLCRTNSITVVFNISGVYVANMCPDGLVMVARAADIVIGNIAEVNSLANVLGLDNITGDDMIIKLYSTLWRNMAVGKLKLEQMHRFGKVLITTNGKDPVFCIAGDLELIKYEVPHIDPQHIKDPTGAGDAFVAGFLNTFLREYSLLDCIVEGCKVAQEVIKRIGVHLDKLKLSY